MWYNWLGKKYFIGLELLALYAHPEKPDKNSGHELHEIQKNRVYFIGSCARISIVCEQKSASNNGIGKKMGRCIFENVK